MPTYEFRCPDGTIVEKIFKMSDVPESIPNPNGAGEAVRIISGGAGLLFKGTGFYITDYGKDGKKDQRAASNESAAAASVPAKTDSTKSEGTKSEGTKSEGTKPTKTDAPTAGSTSGSSSGNSSSTASGTSAGGSSANSSNESTSRGSGSTPKKSNDS